MAKNLSRISELKIAIDSLNVHMNALTTILSEIGGINTQQNIKNLIYTYSDMITLAKLKLKELKLE